MFGPERRVLMNAGHMPRPGIPREGPGHPLVAKTRAQLGRGDASNVEYAL